MFPNEIGRSGQGNNGCIVVADGVFQPFSGNGRQIGAFRKVLEFNQAWEFVTDDIVEVSMECWLFLQNLTEFCIGHNYNAVVFTERKGFIFNNVFPPQTIGGCVVVLQDLFFAVYGINQINDIIISALYCIWNCVQCEIGLSASCW